MGRALTQRRTRASVRTLRGWAYLTELTPPSLFSSPGVDDDTLSWLEKFPPAPRDERDARPQYLAVKSGAEWVLPAAELQDADDSVRDAAARGVAEAVGAEAAVEWVSAAPAGVVTEESGDKTTVFGTKSWVHRGYLQQGAAVTGDHAWCTKDELLERLGEQRFAAIVPTLLLEEADLDHADD